MKQWLEDKMPRLIEIAIIVIVVSMGVAVYMDFERADAYVENNPPDLIKKDGTECWVLEWRKKNQLRCE